MASSNVNEQVKSICKKIDAELILKVSMDSGLIKSNPYEDQRISDVSSELIFELSKKILKNMLPKSVIRRNRYGFSITVTSDKITALCGIVTQSHNFREYGSGEADFRVFINQCHRPQLETAYYFGTAVQATVKEDRLHFLIRFDNNYFYNRYVVYNCIFEIVHIVEEFERKYEEEYPRFRQLREENAERVQREEAERLQRLARERIEAERRREIQRQEEARRMELQRQEEARRRELLNRGATQQGIDIADRLREILDRQGGR